MTEVEQLAQFVHTADYAELSESVAEQLKLRLLDTLGVAIAALDAPALVAIRKLTQTLGGNGIATLIGGGGARNGNRPQAAISISWTAIWRRARPAIRPTTSAPSWRPRNMPGPAVGMF